MAHFHRLVIGLMLLQYSYATSTIGADMWKKGGIIPGLNAIYGDVCLTYNTFVPTCGWRMLLTSSISVTLDIDVIDLRSESVHGDHKSYYLISTSSTRDLTTLGGQCLSAGLTGTISTGSIVIQVHYVCVCTPTQQVDCENDDLGLSSTAVPPTSTALTAATGFSMDNSLVKSSPYEGFNILNPTQISLRQQGTNDCYQGPLTTTEKATNKHKICSSFCTPIQACVGVNFWSEISRCDLVLDVSPNLTLGSARGCQFWKVLWKA